MIEGISDIDVARAVDGCSLRNAESCGAAHSVGASKLSRVARERGHHAGSRDPADDVILGVGHVERARAIDGDTGRSVEPGVASRLPPILVPAGDAPANTRKCVS